VTVKLPARLVELIDELVERGEYKSRGEAIREAVEEFAYRRILFPGVRLASQFKREEPIERVA